MATTSNAPKVGEVVSVKEKGYVVLREKGGLLYVTCRDDPEQKLYLLIFKTKILIETKVPSGIFRLAKQEAAKFPKEITVDAKKVYIWGVPFKKLDEGTYSGESLSFMVQYRKTVITLHIRYQDLILDAVTA